MARPRGTTKAAMAQRRADDWVSAVTGLGHNVWDKARTSSFEADELTVHESRELWRGDDLAARVVEVWPNEELRAGFEFCSNYDDAEDAKELQDAIAARWDELGLERALWMARCYERAYGGGAILLITNDSQTSMASPLVDERVRRFTGLLVIEPEELQPVSWYTDPTKSKFGLPEVWRFQAQVEGGTTPPPVEIHESRLVLFQGSRVSRRAHGTLTGWGDSVLMRVHRVLRGFNVAWQSASILLADFAQAVYKVEGLTAMMAEGEEAAKAIIAARVRALEISRSSARAAMIDARDEFERKQTPLTGMPDMLDRMATRLTAAADMPLTLLMGQSPGGLNATGASDIRFFYDRVSASQAKRIRPAVERVTRLIMVADGLEEPDNWSIKFKPLWQMTDLEVATARKTQADADAAYIDRGVLSPDDVARSRFGGDEYSYETTVDFAARDAVEMSPPPAEVPGKAGEEGAAPPQEPGTPAAEGDVPPPEEQKVDSVRRIDYVEKRGGKWVVLSMGGDVLGEYGTEAEALKRLAQIEYFKHHKG